MTVHLMALHQQLLGRSAKKPNYEHYYVAIGLCL